MNDSMDKEQINDFANDGFQINNHGCDDSGFNQENLSSRSCMNACIKTGSDVDHDGNDVDHDDMSSTIDDARFNQTDPASDFPCNDKNEIFTSNDETVHAGIQEKPDKPIDVTESASTCLTTHDVAPPAATDDNQSFDEKGEPQKMDSEIEATHTLGTTRDSVDVATTHDLLLSSSSSSQHHDSQHDTPTHTESTQGTVDVNQATTNLASTNTNERSSLQNTQIRTTIEADEQKDMFPVKYIGFSGHKTPILCLYQCVLFLIKIK